MGHMFRSPVQADLFVSLPAVEYQDTISTQHIITRKWKNVVNVNSYSPSESKRGRLDNNHTAPIRELPSLGSIMTILPREDPFHKNLLKEKSAW